MKRGDSSIAVGGERYTSALGWEMCPVTPRLTAPPRCSRKFRKWVILLHPYEAFRASESHIHSAAMRVLGFFRFRTVVAKPAVEQSKVCLSRVHAHSPEGDAKFALIATDFTGTPSCQVPPSTFCSKLQHVRLQPTVSHSCCEPEHVVASQFMNLADILSRHVFQSLRPITSLLQTGSCSCWTRRLHEAGRIS